MKPLISQGTLDKEETPEYWLLMKKWSAGVHACLLYDVDRGRSFHVDGDFGGGISRLKV